MAPSSVRSERGRQLAVQPQLRHGPAAFYRGGGNAQCISRLLDAHAAEETAFDDAALTRIVLLEPPQRFIQCDERFGARIRGVAAVLQRGFHFMPGDTFLFAAALLPLLLPRVIEEDLPHRA